MAKNSKGISADTENYDYLDELRQELLKQAPVYKKDISINEALTVVIEFHRQWKDKVEVRE